MKKILFIRLSSLGDVVLTESCIRLAKESFPESEIHYLTKPEYADLVQSYTSVSKVYEWTDKVKLMKALRNEKYDIVIDLHSKFNTFLIKLLCGGKRTITYQKQHLLRWMMAKKLSTDYIDSTVWNYLETLNRVNTHNAVIDQYRLSESKQYYPTITPNAQSIASVQEKFLQYNIPADKYLIGIFPGATHQTKQYPIEKLVNFIYDVPDFWKCCFLILGSWKEKEHVFNMKLLTDIKMYDLVGGFDIPQLIAAISLLDVVITNDSGPMHIAAALKKPQIAIFGATHTRLGFRPLNDNAEILQKNIRCQPCSLHGGKSCKRGSFECMKSIHSSELLTVFKKKFEEAVTS